MAGKRAAAGVRKNLSALLHTMSMKLIGGQGCGVSLDTAAFQSGVLDLSEENLTAIRAQMDTFLDAIDSAGLP